ncbi:transglycosylase family protein [Streptomyces radicis]|uniref:LysM peptidoglycan-binding domain-containing protein n=1 Tax=Streptomyces radicis TaxID=1750517 RepID=A0A3A9W7B1_9ACTN|nr:transglycosylase family protein [Streptomyces radicis]RKN08689.1 LysM peptidoglycan-binding domain-containing protein [Streptomyces radicis]RKN21847.1 LysM peptidoglycan-binding domain-containing protein [Streptomyces radicis]
MRSGTGRHRRPRQAPAFLVAAGVTGAGIALPLLSGGPAQAVSDDTWDRAAECESGGVWSANSGNGYFGGLQLTIAMWEEYGGLEFAGRPDLASRAQQITVAERMLLAQGKEAFPSCGVLSGLWPEFREERDDPDRAEEAEEAQAEEEIGGPEESAAPERTPGADEERASPEGDADDGSESGSADDGAAEAEVGAGEEPSTSSPSPRTPSGEATEDGADATDDPEPGGATGGSADGRAEREGDDGGTDGTDRTGSGRHRGDPDPAEAGRADEEGSGRHAERYEVRRGDTLSAIAVEYGVPGGWPTLHAKNETVIGDDPDYILPGQRLDLTVTGR